jgi:hypothetical protein
VIDLIETDHRRPGMARRVLLVPSRIAPAPDSQVVPDEDQGQAVAVRRYWWRLELAMAFPEFFARVPAVTLRDPLAELLGAAEGGLIEYRFADAVKLTGHSCPTVAGAWLMTVRALRALYGDEIPERGNVAVALRESLDGGVAGVIGSVAGLLTGAAGAGGFKGLGGRHSRRNLLQFGVAGGGVIACLVRMLRSTALCGSKWCPPIRASAAYSAQFSTARRMLRTLVNSVICGRSASRASWSIMVRITNSSRCATSETRVDQQFMDGL